MARMSASSMSTLQKNASSHNKTVCEEIVAGVTKVETLMSEIIVVDAATAQLRDKMTDAAKVFRHQFKTQVLPLIAEPPIADPDPS